MSNAVSALQGRTAPGDVTVTENGLQGMIILRGDLAGRRLRKLCKTLTGVAVPEQGKAAMDGATGICWMSPDELLLLVPYGDAAAAIAKIDEALAGTHYLAENVSDARAFITVQGGYAREVIAKLAPVDLHADVFGPGDFRRTHLGQVAAAFWMAEDESLKVICFRSVAEYVFGLLAASAKAGPVGHL
ncbi:MAG: sarcosine oxidase subunit gamma [Yoonia sp.]|uniref:sarcosine oxidase subunit gamma n=1 Tax=Yoonia sp. TaxID=2212373 RepID=UPI003EF438D5